MSVLTPTVTTVTTVTTTPAATIITNGTTGTIVTTETIVISTLVDKVHVTNSEFFLFIDIPLGLTINSTVIDCHDIPPKSLKRFEAVEHDWFTRNGAVMEGDGKWSDFSIYWS